MIIPHLIMASLVAFLLSMVFTPLVIKFCQKRNILDQPDGNRKIHNIPKSRLGGVAVVGSFFISLLIFRSFLPFAVSFWYLIGLALIFLTGFLDDIFSLPPWVKILGLGIGALIFIFDGVVIEFITLPWNVLCYIGIWGIPLTFFWILGITNSLNLIDGMDGLSSGIAAIAACTLGIIALQHGRWESALISFLLMGSAIGFLPYNFPPAKIFIGDGGALFFGGVLATVSVEGALKSATTFTLAVPILILGIPILDTFFAIVRRKRNKLPITRPDRGHLHHRLLEKGLTQREVILVVYAISTSFSILAILIDRFLANSTYSLLLTLALFYISWIWGKHLGVTELSCGTRKIEKV